MTADIIGRIGPAHPAHPDYAPMSEGEAALRVRIREAIEELEAAGHHGCAEIVRARLFHG